MNPDVVEVDGADLAGADGDLFVEQVDAFQRPEVDEHHRDEDAGADGPRGASHSGLEARGDEQGQEAAHGQQRDAVGEGDRRASRRVIRR